MHTKILMTPENFQKMGYSYDSAMRGWYAEESAKSSRIDRGDGRGFVPNYRRTFIPPFGFTDLMLCYGLQFWVDDKFHLKAFSLNPIDEGK